MILFYITIISIMIGVTSSFWFNQLFIPARKLRNGAKWLDDTSVEVPTETTVKIETLREHHKIGDKIVVSHFLKGWTKDLQRKIFNFFVYGGIAIILYNIYVIVTKGKILLEEHPNFSAVKKFLMKIGLSRLSFSLEFYKLLFILYLYLIKQ